MELYLTGSNKLMKLNLGKNFIINNNASLDTHIFGGANKDIKITAIQDTASKIIENSSLTINNFEIIE